MTAILLSLQKVRERYCPRVCDSRLMGGMAAGKMLFKAACCKSPLERAPLRPLAACGAARRNILKWRDCGGDPPVAVRWRHTPASEAAALYFPLERTRLPPHLAEQKARDRPAEPDHGRSPL